MITLRKLQGLPPKTRARKLLTLLVEPEHDVVYERGIVGLALEILGDPPAGITSVPGVPTLRDRHRLRNRLARYLGLEAADWDFQAPPDRKGPVSRFPFSVWLDDLRSPFNVGSVVRTAEAYGFESVWHSLDTPGMDSPRMRRSAMGAEHHLTVEPLSLEAVIARWKPRPVFALELGGTPVDHFSFPEEGLVLIGGEELGLSPEALAWADASAGRVSLPLYGKKASLNVGVAFGILAAAWTASQNLCPHQSKLLKP